MSATDETMIGKTTREEETLVQGSPVDDEEDEEWLDVQPPAARRRVPRLTLALLVALAAVGGFVLGVQIQKGQAAGGSGSRATSAGGAAGVAGRRAAGAAPASAGGATIGQVKTIAGDFLYVTSFTGNLVKVKTSATTRFTKSEQVTVQSVRPGDTVVVQGTQNKDGSLTAASVALGGGGGFSRSGGGFGAGGGGGGGANGRGSFGG